MAHVAVGRNGTGRAVSNEFDYPAVTVDSVAFDDINDVDLAAARSQVRDATLTAAQLDAAQRLAGDLGGLIDAEAIVEILTSDADHPHAELVRNFGARWALLVLRLLTGTLTHPAAAVADARRAGATVAQIAAAIGLTPQGLYATYRDHIIGQGLGGSARRP